MLNKKKLIAILLILLGLIFYSFDFLNERESVNNDETKSEQIPVHNVKFYDEKTFIDGVKKAENIEKSDYLVRGGIVPHHLFAGEIIADFFKRLSLQNPKTIILIGPNHYEKGEYKALSSLYNWGTPYGTLETDQDITKKLLEEKLIHVDEKVLPEDHSLSGMMPFIKYFMPDTKIVTILLKGTFTETESEILASKLKDVLNENIIVVAPVDFSHYLTSSQAKEKDAVTLKIMKEFNYRNLYSLNNEYLDSPASIGVLLMLMQKINSTNMDLLINTNSGEMQRNSSIESTSYFSAFYY